MNVAAAAMEGTPVRKDDPRLKAPPSAGTVLPDILMFSTGVHNNREISADFMPRDADAWQFPNMIPAGALFVGISQSFAKALVQHSVNGESGYVSPIGMYTD